MGTIILIYLVLFIKDVISIRGRILSGNYNFDAYGSEISGAGGANVDLNTKYGVATDDDPSLGPKDAPVSIVEFSDFECPFCQQSYPIIRSLVTEFSGQIRYIYRDFPLQDIHPDAHLAARAGYCANKQDKFWPLHDKLFQNQDALSQKNILTYANQIGLNIAALNACLDSPEAKDEVDADIKDGLEAGVQGTPTWFINGARAAGVIPESAFRKIIEDIINK